MATFTVKNHGEFESPHTDDEVRRRLAQYLKDGKLKSEFATDYSAKLLSKFRQYGRWFENQTAWAHYFVFEVEKPLLAAPKKQLISGMVKIVDHLQRCRESRDQGGAGLKNPQVRIDLNGTKFTLKLAGPRSRNKGKVSVAESHRFGEGRFFGWIEENGDFDRRGCCGQDVVDLLLRIAIDPATVISEIGKEMGLCCYCWAPLTQAQSKIAGCGKTCADNYGAWWPNAAETREFVAEHPEVLVGATDAERWENSAPERSPLVMSMPQADPEDVAGHPLPSNEDLEELEAATHFLRSMNDS